MDSDGLSLLERAKLLCAAAEAMPDISSLFPGSRANIDTDIHPTTKESEPETGEEKDNNCANDDDDESIIITHPPPSPVKITKMIPTDEQSEVDPDFPVNSNPQEHSKQQTPTFQWKVLPGHVAAFEGSSLVATSCDLRRHLRKGQHIRLNENDYRILSSGGEFTASTFTLDRDYHHPSNMELFVRTKVARKKTVVIPVVKLTEEDPHWTTDTEVNVDTIMNNLEGLALDLKLDREKVPHPTGKGKPKTHSTKTKAKAASESEKTKAVVIVSEKHKQELEQFARQRAAARIARAQKAMRKAQEAQAQAQVEQEAARQAQAQVQLEKLRRTRKQAKKRILEKQAKHRMAEQQIAEQELARVLERDEENKAKTKKLQHLTKQRLLTSAASGMSFSTVEEKAAGCGETTLNTGQAQSTTSSSEKYHELKAQEDARDLAQREREKQLRLATKRRLATHQRQVEEQRQVNEKTFQRQLEEFQAQKKKLRRRPGPASKEQEDRKTQHRSIATAPANATRRDIESQSQIGRHRPHSTSLGTLLPMIDPRPPAFAVGASVNPESVGREVEEEALPRVKLNSNAHRMNGDVDEPDMDHHESHIPKELGVVFPAILSSARYSDEIHEDRPETDSGCEEEEGEEGEKGEEGERSEEEQDREEDREEEQEEDQDSQSNASISNNRPKKGLKINIEKMVIPVWKRAPIPIDPKPTSSYGRR